MNTPKQSVLLVGMFTCILIAIASILYVANSASVLKSKFAQKEQNEKYFNNFEDEQISVLKSSHYFDNKETKSNLEELREVGPIPDGKFISSFVGKGAGTYTYKDYERKDEKRLVYYEEEIPKRDSWGDIIRDFDGSILYEKIGKTKWVNGPWYDIVNKQGKYEYTYCLTIIDLSDSITANAPDSIYTNYTKQFTKLLTAYKNWEIVPNKHRCKNNDFWTNNYGKILNFKREAISFQTKDQNGTLMVRSVYYANNKAYVLDVHSPHRMFKEFDKILCDFTTCYLADYNKSVILLAGKTLLCALLFVIACLIAIILGKKSLNMQSNTTTKNDTAKKMSWYISMAFGVNMFCVFFDIYPLYLGEISIDDTWWEYFIVILCSILIVNIFTLANCLSKIKDKYTFDFIVPIWLKDYLYKRNVTNAEYKSFTILVGYPLYILGNLPFGIIIIAYIIPVSALFILMMEIRNFINWLNTDEKKGIETDHPQTLSSFKDYYFILDINTNATEEEVTSAFNKMVAKYHSSIDAKIYGKDFLSNAQEAYRVLSSTNRLRPEHDKEYADFQASQKGNWIFKNENLRNDIAAIQANLFGDSKEKPSTYKKISTKNLMIIAFFCYWLLLIFFTFGTTMINKSQKENERMTLNRPPSSFSPPPSLPPPPALP